MRNLIALLACSFIMTAANANDLTPVGRAESPKADLGKAPPASIKPKLGLPAASLAAAARAREDQAEVDLSAKIAARLVVMRANQVARAANAVRAKKKVAAQKSALPLVSLVPPLLHGSHWSYEGESGPSNWGKINADWAKCGSGARQSPIDIRDGIKVDLEPIAFDYHPSSFSVIDNGHTVQVNVSPGNFITIQNRMYELQQFHFHRPSEERINGKGFDMVVHLVHKDVEGKLAVIAVMLERGKAQGTIQTIWNNLPLEKNEAATPAIVIDVADLLPPRLDYFTYIGSMTIPPCNEGVLWMVMKDPIQASAAQMALFSRLYPLNARPIQASSGRMIKESN